jgi:glyoxylase I family protein
LEVLQEIYREERDSYKLDLALNGNYIVELFSFLILLKTFSSWKLRFATFSFEVNNVEQTRFFQNNIPSEDIRWMNILENNFSLLPDDLPIEFYEY